MNIEDIAKIAHNINVAYCLSIGDTSHFPWDAAPSWQRETAFSGVRFHLEHPDARPENSHAEWSRVKKEAGWIYGEVKDASKKTHPCLVPYDELPIDQKAKDYLFIAVVEQLRPFLT